MSPPRPILPGATYLITRRTVLRHMLLRPDHVMNQILYYLLAVLASKYQVQVHAFCAMSTHIHLVATDVHGTLPMFLGEFHRISAMCTKVLRGWDDAVWDKAQTSLVHLGTQAAVVQKIAYVLANPVAAGLVCHAHQWPGARTTVRDIGVGVVSAARPAVYLDPENPIWPAQAALAVSLPPEVKSDQAASFQRQVATEVERLEADARAELERQRRRLIGADGVRAMSPTERATTPEPRFQRNPTFAVGPNQGDAWKRAAAALRTFRTSYRAALDLWRAGVRDIVFPAGTWLMRVLHNAVVAAPAPTPAT